MLVTNLCWLALISRRPGRDLSVIPAFALRSRSCGRSHVCSFPFMRQRCWPSKNRVIALRLAKIARCGTAAFDEAQLMITEKIRAAHEATETLMTGGTTAAVISRYHEHVTGNVGRLLRG